MTGKLARRAAALLLAFVICILNYAMVGVSETVDDETTRFIPIPSEKTSLGSTTEPTESVSTPTAEAKIPSENPTPTPNPTPGTSTVSTPDRPIDQDVPTEISQLDPSPESAATPEPTRPSDSSTEPIPQPSPDPGSQEIDSPIEPVPEPLPTIAPELATTPEPAEDDSESIQAGQGDGSGLKRTSNKPRKEWKGVVPAEDGGMPIPKLFQYHHRTILCKYGGIPRSVSTSGCNVTCVAMVVAYLTGKERSPEELFAWAIKNKLYHGAGLGHSEMSTVAAKHGVSGKWIGRDGSAVIEALKAGKPVIAHMGPGLFTKRGHYIVLRGLTEDGKILVNDPNSAHRSKLAYPMSTILRQTKTSTPFMVCEVINGGID